VIESTLETGALTILQLSKGSGETSR